MKKKKKKAEPQISESVYTTIGEFNGFSDEEKEVFLRAIAVTNIIESLTAERCEVEDRHRAAENTGN